MIHLLILALLTSCSTASLNAARSPKYVRKHWKHWTDQNKDCLNTRHEILQKRSLVPVILNKKGCSVRYGQWKDFYYPEVHTNARKVDIDHLVPLKHAHEMGGASWNKDKKEQFANDPENLVITNRRYNRQKGAKTIAEWLPVHKDYACKYVKEWIRIKSKYQLSIQQAEQKTIDQLQGTCHLPLTK